MARLTPEHQALLQAAILRYHPDDDQEEVAGVPIDAEDAEELFGQVMGEMQATEQDWHTAAPSAPLVALLPQQVEPALPQWDGPLRPIARTPFDDVFEQEQWEEYRSRLPQFEALTGRFDPFELDKLRDLFDGQSYSTFLKRPVLTFKDALDHSILLALFWLEEDAAAHEAHQEELVLVHEEIDPKGSYAERCEAARQVWKDAVQHRKMVLELEDAKVSAARIAWHEEKLKR